MCVKDGMKIIFWSVKQISNEEHLGTNAGFVCSKKEQSQAPQESPERAWKVTLHDQSKEIQEQFNTDDYGWAIDTSFKVTVIEW